mmetsp:Transcript_18519/g.30335  ORF Transcript_18519/g.30335 Transcript_18519/m.30335 type:complete len:109 (+) Transcript_18519:7155-7481(+)
MPHAELKYSNDISLDAPSILARIETVIQNHDPDSGACKGRAYPAAEFHHTHVIVDISMLPKAHRDQAFVNALQSDLATAIKAMIPVPCYFSLNIGFSGSGYLTTEHHP